MLNALQKIDFHGDNIIAFKDEDNENIYVNIRGICVSFGIDFSSQRKKIVSDPVYENALVREDITTSFGIKESLFLDHNYLHGWLFSIQTNRLKPEIREKHIAYKRECFRVLSDYFTKGIAVAPGADTLVELTDRVDKLEQKVSNRNFKAPSKNSMSHEQVKSGILEAVSTGEKTTDELYAHFSRHISARVLHAALMELERESLIVALLQATHGRPATLYQKL